MKQEAEKNVKISDMFVSEKVTIASLSTTPKGENYYLACSTCMEITLKENGIENRISLKCQYKQNTIREFKTKASLSDFKGRWKVVESG